MYVTMVGHQADREAINHPDGRGANLGADEGFEDSGDVPSGHERPSDKMADEWHVPVT
jgi:hypothetical protein